MITRYALHTAQPLILTSSDSDAIFGTGSNNDSACDIVAPKVSDAAHSPKRDEDSSTNRTTSRTLRSFDYASTRATRIQTRYSSGCRSSENLERWHNHYDRLKDLTATGKARVGRMAAPSDYRSENLERQSGTVSDVDETDTAGQDGSAVGEEGEDDDDSGDDDDEDS